MKSLVSIVIPVYKEVENIKDVVKCINKSLADAIDYEIIFVDDNSEDGSLQVCNDLSTLYPVRMIVRTNKRGLSSAVIDGIHQTKGKYIIIMDGDLSHPASAIPNMIKKLSSNEADFVLGSRYVGDGGIDKNWSIFRHLSSRFATLLALPLVSVKDPMSGFFSFKRESLPEPNLLSPIGYKIGLEIMVKNNFRKIVESQYCLLIEFMEKASLDLENR
jgi:dolichol-phosphate mannosyltransferase